jgi:hypothetical protein
MAGIFANSALIIAATSASTCDEGFLSYQPAPGISISARTVAGEEFQVLAGQYSRPHPITSKSAGLAIREQWPLLGRGWVLQERLLSPRVLHMTHREMIWECGEVTWCECYVDDSIEVASMGKIEYALANDGQSRMELAKAWQAIVDQYTMLDLTVPSDKLWAISGLAKRIAEQRPGARYLAGLWDDSR